MNRKQILHGHAGTLLERASTKAILSDAFNNDISKINALMSAYDIGIVTSIQAQFPLGNLERSNAINKLIKQHSMLEDKAAWAVDQWIAAVDCAVIREMQAHKNNWIKRKRKSSLAARIIRGQIWNFQVRMTIILNKRRLTLQISPTKLTITPMSN